MLRAERCLRILECLSGNKEEILARKSLIVKNNRPSKFKVREYNRCPICGRSRGYYRKFDMCRICFREMALKGVLPGVTKSSW